MAVLHFERNRKIGLVEFLLAGIAESHGCRADGNLLSAPADLEIRNGQVPVHDAETCPVFENAVFGPFHAHEPWSQYGKTRLPEDHFGFGIGFGVKLFLRGCRKGKADKCCIYKQLSHYQSSLNSFSPSISRVRSGSLVVMASMPQSMSCLICSALLIVQEFVLMPSLWASLIH